MTTSPYFNQPVSNWPSITRELVNSYPISHEEILDIAAISWSRLWDSAIGGQINIRELDLPATVVGYFFQKLFSHELSSRHPHMWKGEELKSDKDLVNIIDERFSTEMKSSGQLGYKIFGNRSYNQQSETSGFSGKDKSGFYITLNFYGQTMTLLRLGWIDQDDWIPQGSATGQAATLKPEVYTNKLVPIFGPYMRQSPIQLLDGIGARTANYLNINGIYTFGDLINYPYPDTKISSIRRANKALLTRI
ncbi:ScaI family restriction endonuclease [Aeromonas veronii]|uniref:ScaI family restriction endonuclease n=1 Tax=Aeromonas veronii TaxID=654 RepID=UPI001F158F40|nr:ScaI family restriction endonuclease [Aeromonas veronii]MCF5893132.1 ScaI family restriction endonuclease [Aeromonas veronii]